jgi:hypothetical protein
MFANYFCAAIPVTPPVVVPGLATAYGLKVVNGTNENPVPAPDVTVYLLVEPPA